ncbi:MAG: MurT ligase domain-containing protein [bacterium]|nr:MurT ligase domain-containing protein [bacterium]
MDLKLAGSILAAKALHSFLRTIGSGATAAPGLAALKLEPQALRKLAKNYSDIILISGTNGKTTTSRLISSILDEAKIKHIDNREGSNLARGLATSLAREESFWGRREASTAVFEVDEAALPLVVSELHPRVIVLGNLFRDQLDRYGEVNTIRSLWIKAVKNLDSSTTLVLNADDPALASLSQTKAKVLFYGVEDQNIDLGKAPHASDYLNCTNCGGELTYERIYLSHLGVYSCKNCGFKRPKLDLKISSIKLDGLAGSAFELESEGFRETLHSPLPGLYNLYNVLAAAACARALNLDLALVKKTLKQFQAAFGRTEKISVEGKKIFVSLVKNPTGFNEVLRTVFETTEKKIALVAINDLIADGRDVSWLWDVDFESLKGKLQKLVVSGLRASDMELRAKYAELENCLRIDSLETALAKTLSLAESGQTIFLFPTYTSMLKIKAYLAKKGYSPNFWEE